MCRTVIKQVSIPRIGARQDDGMMMNTKTIKAVMYEVLIGVETEETIYQR